MNLTEETITKCFDKAKFKDDRAKYLFKLLCDAIHSLFLKNKKKFEEEAIIDILLEGYSITIGACSINSKENSSDYNGNKDFVVNTFIGTKPKGFNSIKAAMTYAEEHA